MFESVFGAEMPLAVKALIVLLLVLALIFAVFWVARRFGVDRLGATAARGRQPRLAVIDAAAVGDGRRRLILIRRDNVEHLLMIGGPTDVVIEPNIVRASAPMRESPAARAPATAEPLPRALPLGDAGAWPLQPEPAPIPRPQRATPIEEPAQWPAEPELPPPPAPRRQPRQPVDPLAGIAAEVARLPEPVRAPTPDLGGPGGFMPREPVRPREAAREREVQIEREPLREREALREREPAREREAPVREPMREPIREPMREAMREREPIIPIIRETMRERDPMVREAAPREPAPREPAPREPAMRESREREPARMREPPPPAAEPEFNASADQNLADMAQRLEAALRRPAKAAEARTPEPRAIPPDTGAAPPATPRAAPPPAEAAAARAEPKPAKSVYDSLEKEMASLLGRPSGKS
jgi:hypothetical protein